MNNNPLTITQSDVIRIINFCYKENPITGAEISKLVGIVDRDRKIGANMRSIINTLRDKGYSICANSKGYYIPRTPAELKEYIDDFQHRIDQQQRACDSLKSNYDNWLDIKSYGQGGLGI